MDIMDVKPGGHTTRNKFICGGDRGKLLFQLWVTSREWKQVFSGEFWVNGGYL